MKIVVVGATGTIGRYVSSALAKNGTEIIPVGRKSGVIKMDFTNEESIRKGFEQIGKFDSLVSTAGEVASEKLQVLTSEHWKFSFNSKLLGQILLAQHAVPYLNDGGSITLTTGITADEPFPHSVAKTTVNRALEGFVFSAAHELPRGIRINAVSPGLLEDSAPFIGHLFQGYTPVSGQKVALEYAKAVFGIKTGHTFKLFT